MTIMFPFVSVLISSLEPMWLFSIATKYESDDHLSLGAARTKTQTQT
jgi:hypothetical protein